MRAPQIRFSGMASGMDTDSIVKDMMRPQQYKIDQEKKQQALIQLRQDAWEDMNKKLSGFHRNFTEKMSRGSTYNSTTSSSSDKNIIDIADNAIIPAGTHRFEVKRLATGPSITSKIEIEGDLKSSTKLSELVGGKDDTADTDYSFKMQVNGEKSLLDIEVKSSDTIGDLTKRINEKLSAKGFTARFDADNGLFSINSSKTGSKQNIKFSSKSTGENELLKKLNIKHGVDDKGEEIVYRGQDAEYEYNGVKLESATNNVEVNGVKVTLKAVTTGAEEVTISSAIDPDATYEFVKEFVTEYNKLIDELHEKLDTKPGKDIMPLTSEEREAMSDHDIKLWEDKINNSLFYQDNDLKSFVDSARQTLGQVLGTVTDGDKEVKFEGGYNSLASLGIVTGDWREKGKLYIIGDEELGGIHAGKDNILKEKLSKNPEGVNKLLQKLGKDLYDTHEKDFRTGNRLKSAMRFYNDKVMADKLKSHDERISKLEERMFQMEERQYAKFAAMESMLHKLNSQGDWLMQQFGGMY